MLYSTFVWAVITMVPVGTAHVGCVAVAVGTAGGVGTALITTAAAPGVLHVLSSVLLTLKA